MPFGPQPDPQSPTKATGPTAPTYVPAYSWLFSLGPAKSGTGANAALVNLTRFEVPEEFTVGHEAKLAVHQYIAEGGAPTIKTHSMGAFPIPTQWKGILFGNTAQTRMQLLDALFIAQQPLTFTYGPLQWLVQPKGIKFTVKYQLEIHYELEIVVLQDLNGNTQSIDTSASLQTGTLQAYNAMSGAMTVVQATAPATLAIPANVITTYTALNTAYSAASPLGQQTQSTLLSLLNNINHFITTVSAYVTALESVAVLYSDLQALNQSQIALNNAIILSNSLYYLTGSGQNQQQTTAPNFVGSLLTLAAQYYPNSDVVNAAQAIANANGLIDLVTTRPTTIVIPQLVLGT
jgi:hypothetical protein